MEEIIKTIANNIEEGNFSELTVAASKIATTALSSFHGELLRKAIAISVSIIDFEDELAKS
jgi:hypothetical protein